MRIFSDDTGDTCRSTRVVNAPRMCRALMLLSLGLTLPFAAEANEAATIQITQPSGVSVWWAGVFITSNTTGVIEQVTFY